MEKTQRLELVLETAIFCRKVRNKGMPSAVWSKTMREAIFSVWEKRGNKSKISAAKYRSANSQDLVFGKNELRYDHAIPMRLVQQEIMESNPLNIKILKEILDRKVISCLLTKSEDEKLTYLGLRSKMPDGWDGIDPLARYKKAQIEIVQNELFVS